MVIETERLLLREMVEEDFSALYKVLADSYERQGFDPAASAFIWTRQFS